jgi:hypothetical protein
MRLWDKHELRNITQFKMNLTKNRGWSQVLWKGGHMFFTNWCTRPHIVFTDGRQQQPNHNTTTYCGHMKHDAKKHSYKLLLSSLVNTICGRIMTVFIVVIVRQ